MNQIRRTTRGDVVLKSDIGRSTRSELDSVKVLASSGRGMTGWMFRLAQLLANRNRFSVLLELEKADSSSADLRTLLGVDLSTVSRLLGQLREGGLVANQVVGFRRGPVRVACLTVRGRQLLESLRGIALQIVQSQDIPSEVARHGLRSEGRAGRVTVDRSVFVQLLEELETFHKWRMVRGLLSEPQFHAKQRWLYRIANDVGVDLAWLKNITESEITPSGRAK